MVRHVDDDDRQPEQGDHNADECSSPDCSETQEEGITLVLSTLHPFEVADAYSQHHHCYGDVTNHDSP